MKKILVAVTVSFLSFLSAYGQPVSTNSTAVPSNSERLMLSIKDATPSQFVELICSYTGASSVASYFNGAKLSFKSNGPVTTAEAEKLAEKALADEGYFTKTIGECFVCVPKDRAWTLKGFTSWPEKGKDEKADIFYNFTATPIIQVLSEFADLAGRKVVGETPFGVTAVHSKYLTLSQAKMLLEIACAVAGYKVELVGDNEVKLVRLKRE